jgi:hypothetical protein
MALATNGDEYGGTGLSLEEALAYEAQHAGGAPPLIDGIAQRMFEGALTHGAPFADAVLKHCVKSLQLSKLDQAWIWSRWERIMLRHH